VNKNTCAAVLTFGMMAFTGEAEACPDYNQSGEAYRATGADLYTPRSFNVVAGGSNTISGCRIRPQTDQGDGWVASSPDFTFDLSGMDRYRLVVSAVSKCDTVLLINTGKANWYFDDDDGGNMDPQISLTRPSNGWLDVWVGTYDAPNCDAVLTLETFDR
jgi:hypothetical protein